MPTDYIRYDLLVQDALRSVVRKVLTDAARSGLPGEHHFNITFKTQAPGVIIPAVMLQRYPEEMAIILQHQFWDLAVNEDGFEVSLSFSRKPERLVVPFNAISGFSDPSVPFGFKLEPRVDAVEPGPVAPVALAAATLEKPASIIPKAPSKDVKPGKAKADEKAGDVDGPTKVVSIDAFRKK